MFGKFRFDIITNFICVHIFHRLFLKILLPTGFLDIRSAFCHDISGRTGWEKIVHKFYSQSANAVKETITSINVCKWMKKISFWTESWLVNLISQPWLLLSHLNVNIAQKRTLFRQMIWYEGKDHKMNCYCFAWNTMLRT